MITTVTLNPSLDLTLEVDELAVGRVSRAASDRIAAAGKGVNVATALAENGFPARALAAMDPAAANRYAELLPAPSILEVLPITGVIRTNVAIVQPHGVVTKVNGPGPRYDEVTLRSVIAAIDARIAGSAWVVLSGSLPPGCPLDLYATLVAHCRAAGCQVAIDADGEALRRAAAASPDLVKPNRAELELLVERPVVTIGDALDAAKALVAGGVGTVLCSLGPDGALLVRDELAVHGWVSPLAVDSHVGAGDALLAGYLASDDAGADGLRAAVAWGTAACRLPGTAMPRATDIPLDEVTLDDAPDRARRLSGPPRPAGVSEPAAATRAPTG